MTDRHEQHWFFDGQPRRGGRITSRAPRSGSHEADPIEQRDVEHLLRQRLASAEAPDLTRSIMGRLGYMHVPEPVARRRRRQRWMLRAAVCLLAAVTVMFAIEAHRHSPDARRPLEVTVPSALGNDLARQQHRVNSLIKVLRESAPLETADVASSFDNLTDPAVMPATMAEFEQPARSDVASDESHESGADAGEARQPEPRQPADRPAGRPEAPEPAPRPVPKAPPVDEDGVSEPEPWLNEEPVPYNAPASVRWV